MSPIPPPAAPDGGSQLRQPGDGSESHQPHRPSHLHALAVALRYDPLLEGAPRLIAKGDGDLGLLIRQMARQQDVPVHENPDLAQALSSVALNSVIPPALFDILAEVIAFVYRLDHVATPSTTPETGRR